MWIQGVYHFPNLTEQVLRCGWKIVPQIFSFWVFHHVLFTPKHNQSLCLSVSTAKGKSESHRCWRACCTSESCSAHKEGLQQRCGEILDLLAFTKIVILVKADGRGLTTSALLRRCICAWFLSKQAKMLSVEDVERAGKDVEQRKIDFARTEMILHSKITL